MKIRNKKTGEIIELTDDEYIAFDVVKMLFRDKNDWVDYSPTIEEEKTRKLIKQWAKTFELTSFKYIWHDELPHPYGTLFGTTENDPNITYRLDVPMDLPLLKGEDNIDLKYLLAE